MLRFFTHAALMLGTETDPQVGLCFSLMLGRETDPQVGFHFIELLFYQLKYPVRLPLAKRLGEAAKWE